MFNYYKEITMTAYSDEYYKKLIKLSDRWEKLENKFVLDGVLLEGKVQLELSNPTLIGEDIIYPQSTVCYYHPKLGKYSNDLVEGDDVLDVLRELVDQANDDYEFADTTHHYYSF